jgi:hypothetical protein
MLLVQHLFGSGDDVVVRMIAAIDEEMRGVARHLAEVDDGLPVSSV